MIALAGAPAQEIQRLRETGLLQLVIPRTYGGVGATWVDAFKIVQISQADGSIGQLYANQSTEGSDRLPVQAAQQVQTAWLKGEALIP